VINLSPYKSRVFNEAFRVLKPGGRLIVSDIVLFGDLPDSIRNDPDAYAGCLSGASKKDEYLNIIKDAGFQGKEVIEENPVEIPAQVFDANKGEFVKIEELPKYKLNFLNELKAASIKVKAYKPK
jgi:arsenite methyltransferase